MDGNDVVFTIEISEPGTLFGEIAGSYAALHVLNQCPDQEPVAPTECIAFGSGPDGGSFGEQVDPGVYFVIVSTWTPPQATDYVFSMWFEPENQNAPDWSVDPVGFNYDGEIIAEVFIDDIPETGPGGILGAFVGEELRGVQHESTYGPEGKLVFIMRVFSDVPSGETINFRYYDPDHDMIFNALETVEFESDMTIGDALVPLSLHCYSFVTLEKELRSGWTWFSLTVINPDMGLGNVFASYPVSAGDYI